MEATVKTPKQFQSHKGYNTPLQDGKEFVVRVLRWI